MTGDRGPISTYELIWRSGHVEQVQAHQVLLPHSTLFGEPPTRERMTFHGEIDGRWQLVLDVDYADVLSVRLLPVDAVPVKDGAE